MNLKLLRKAYDHLWWADEMVGASLESALGPDENGRFPRGEDGARAEKAIELYAHILGAEITWIDRIEGLPPSNAYWPQVDLRRCKGLLRTVKMRYTDLLDGVVSEDLARGIHYVNSEGLEFTSTIEDILIHVVLHGSYHRGQVALIIREGGDTPASTDYIAFVRGAPVATKHSVQDP
jgi:uncharacterized damage-inducible protein DinB